jgi:hypothetical protein
MKNSSKFPFILGATIAFIFSVAANAQQSPQSSSFGDQMFSNNEEKIKKLILEYSKSSKSDLDETFKELKTLFSNYPCGASGRIQEERLKVYRSKNATLFDSLNSPGKIDIYSEGKKDQYKVTSVISGCGCNSMRLDQNSFIYSECFHSDILKASRKPKVPTPIEENTPVAQVASTPVISIPITLKQGTETDLPNNIKVSPPRWKAVLLPMESIQNSRSSREKVNLFLLMNDARSSNRAGLEKNFLNAQRDFNSGIFPAIEEVNLVRATGSSYLRQDEIKPEYKDVMIDTPDGRKIPITSKEVSPLTHESFRMHSRENTFSSTVSFNTDAETFKNHLSILLTAEKDGTHEQRTRLSFKELLHRENSKSLLQAGGVNVFIVAASHHQVTSQYSLESPGLLKTTLDDVLHDDENMPSGKKMYSFHHIDLLHAEAQPERLSVAKFINETKNVVSPIFLDRTNPFGTLSRDYGILEGESISDILKNINSKLTDTKVMRTFYVPLPSSIPCDVSEMLVALESISSGQVHHLLRTEFNIIDSTIHFSDSVSDQLKAASKVVLTCSN